MMIVLFER